MRERTEYWSLEARIAIDNLTCTFEAHSDDEDYNKNSESHPAMNEEDSDDKDGEQEFEDLDGQL